MQVSSTVSVVELILMLVCLPGLYYTGRLFASALRDQNLLRLKRINSFRSYAAMTTTIMFGSWMMCQMGFVITDGLLMTIKNNQSLQHPSARYVWATGVIFISFLFDAASYIVERRRQILLEKIREVEDMGH